MTDWRKGPPTLLTLTEVAERLRTSTSTVERMIKAGTFPLEVVKVGSRRRVRSWDVDRYLAGETAN